LGDKKTEKEIKDKQIVKKLFILSEIIFEKKKKKKNNIICRILLKIKREKK